MFKKINNYHLYILILIVFILNTILFKSIDLTFAQFPSPPGTPGEQTTNIVVNPLQEDLNLGRHNVTVTMYNPTPGQTDKTPNITADGTRINPNKATSYRYIALSRNLLKRWGGPFDYGDFILIKGTTNGHKDGVYHVRDTMNPKYVNYVDILESTNVKPYKYEKVQMYRMNWTDNIQLINNN